MTRRLTLMLICLLCFGLLCCSAQVNDSRQSQIINEQISVSESNGQLSYIFSNALRSARLPGGIVHVSSCSSESDEATYFFPAANGTLRSILDSIAALNPAYGWEFQNGAINLLPKSINPPFLDITIRDFIIDKPKVSIASSVGKLLEVPEVKRALESLKLHQPGPSLIVLPGNTSPDEIKLEAHNVTVREALNEIAKAHGHAVWEYSESHCDGENTFSITWVSR